MSKKHHHLASPWSTVLTFDHPQRSVLPFRVHNANHNSTDGGLAPGGLTAQIEALLHAGGRATIECYRTFVACALREGFSFNEAHKGHINIRNRGKFDAAIAEHRPAVNSSPVLRDRLNSLSESLRRV